MVNEMFWWQCVTYGNNFIMQNWPPKKQWKIQVTWEEQWTLGPLSATSFCSIFLFDLIHSLDWDLKLAIIGLTTTTVKREREREDHCVAVPHPKTHAKESRVDRRGQTLVARERKRERETDKREHQCVAVAHTKKSLWVDRRSQKAVAKHSLSVGLDLAYR